MAPVMGVGKTDADLSRQSACDAWTVRDVAGHLTNRAEPQIASMTRGRAGDSAAPEGFSSPSDNMAISAANADADVGYTQSMGDTLLPTFEERYQELSALLDSFSGDEWHSPCWHPRRGTMTAREYVGQRIQELVVHDWDMRSAFDPNAVCTRTPSRCCWAWYPTGCERLSRAAAVPARVDCTIVLPAKSTDDAS